MKANKYIHTQIRAHTNIKHSDFRKKFEPHKKAYELKLFKYTSYSYVEIL